MSTETSDAVLSTGETPVGHDRQDGCFLVRKARTYGEGDGLGDAGPAAFGDADGLMEAGGDADGLRDEDAPGFGDGDGLADAPVALGEAAGFGRAGMGGLIPSNSTSKISIAFGPMSEPAPRPPYARSAGIKS